MAKILVTGAAGFIGYHASKRLLARGDEVIGLDNLNPYYDPALKENRLSQLRNEPGFCFQLMELADLAGINQLFDTYQPDSVIHLAAQAGLQYSVDNPHAYVESNLVGFVNILEGCRRRSVKHLTYASSSSVYGGNTKMPFSEHDPVDHPLSLYAATKKANELLAHSYSHLFCLPTTGLRFFSVYGPWGRPDMAAYIFTRKILAGEKIEVFNEGKMLRDFTYIDDVVEGVVRVNDRVARANPNWKAEAPDASTSNAPYQIYNIGNHQPVQLMEMIGLLEKHIGRRAEKIMLPMQPGHVPATFADVDDLIRDVGFTPATSLDEGLGKFVEWYRSYHKS